MLIAALAAAAAGLASAADAATVFNTSLSDPPGVFFGSGNFNDGYAVTTQDGVEIGLKSKINRDASDSVTPVGDIYHVGLGNKINFDYAVIPGSVDLGGYTATLTLRNVNTGQTFSFDPGALSDNTTSGTAYENSEQLGFFPIGFDMTKNDNYAVTLALDNGKGSAFSVENLITVGTGAIPEPASWALMMLGIGGIGAALRRKGRPALGAIA
jgi:hypothetical protein